MTTPKEGPDADDLREALADMGMAPEWPEQEEGNFGDPRALNMAEAPDWEKLAPTPEEQAKTSADPANIATKALEDLINTPPAAAIEKTEKIAGLTAQIDALNAQREAIEKKAGFMRNGSERLALNGGIAEQIAALEKQIAEMHGGDQAPTESAEIVGLKAQIDALNAQRKGIEKKPGFLRNGSERLALNGGIAEQIAALEEQIAKAREAGDKERREAADKERERFNDLQEPYDDYPKGEVAEDAELSYAGRADDRVITDRIEDLLPPDTSPEQIAAAAAIVQELRETPPGKMKRMMKGLANLGPYLDLGVNRSIEGIAGGLGKMCNESSRDAEGKLQFRAKGPNFMCRVLSSTRNMFKERAENTRRIIDGKDATLARKGLVKGGSIASWGVAASNFFMGIPGIVRRVAIIGTNVMGSSMEIAKDAHMANFKLREKLSSQREKDIQTAADEAWTLYADAQRAAGGEKPTRAQLSGKLAEKLPAALLKRLAESPDGVSTAFFREGVAKDMRDALTSVQEKLDAIENGQGSEEEKRVKREKLIKGGLFKQNWAAFLRDAERMITVAGGIDMLSYAGRLTERAGKAARIPLMVGLLADLTEFYKNNSHVHELLTPPGHEHVAGAAGAAAKAHEAAGSFVTVKQGDSLSGIIERLHPMDIDAAQHAHDVVQAAGAWGKGGVPDLYLTTHAVKAGMKVGEVGGKLVLETSKGVHMSIAEALKGGFLEHGKTLAELQGHAAEAAGHAAKFVPLDKAAEVAKLAQHHKEVMAAVRAAHPDGAAAHAGHAAEAAGGHVGKAAETFIINSAYSPAEHGMIVREIGGLHSETSHLHAALKEYEAKYGDRPAFAQFQKGMEKQLDKVAKLTQRIESAAATGKLKISESMVGNVSPEETGKSSAEAVVSWLSRNLLTADEKIASVAADANAAGL